MEWMDDGIILTARAHGENAVIVSLLTEKHGRHAGLVNNGQSARMQSVLQAGAHVKAEWNARLVDHLGRYNLELVASPCARWLDHPEILSIIASATSMTELCLPERQPLPGVYAGLSLLLNLEDETLWGAVYVKWEMELLRALGYGLDLETCALTGETEDLSFVSPRTGRAVTRMAAQPYAPKLLPLPRFLCGATDWDDRDILQGLELMGHFLSRSLLAHNHGQTVSLRLGEKPSPFPPARNRLVEYYKKKTA